MICEAVIGTALRGDGSTSLPTLGSTAPVKLMPTPDGVFIVGTAAAPLNGDRISLDIYVAPQTELTIRTVAASLAWPGTSPIPSQFTINARVGEGASLSWLPEALVPVAGSRHRMVANVELGEGAQLVWREEIVLGRPTTKRRASCHRDLKSPRPPARFCARRSSSAHRISTAPWCSATPARPDGHDRQAANRSRTASPDSR